MFARYTFDNTNQFLPTDYPQFPRQFLSRNQFFTGEYNETLSPNTFNSARLSFSRTRIGQNVEANTSQPLAPFVPGRELMGDIDIGGLKRFGPQSSGNLRLVQNVFSFQDDLDLFARKAPREGRRARRALPGQHGQPDLQPGHLLVPEPERVPAQRAEQLRRPDAGGAIRSLLALHALRLLRAGRVPRHAAADAQRRPALRVHHDARGYLRARFVAAGSIRVAANRRSVVREPDVHEPLASRRRGVGRLRRWQDSRPRRLRPLLQHDQPAEPDRYRHQSAGDAAAGHRQSDLPDAGLQPRRRDLDAAGAVRSRQSAHPRLQRQRAARAFISHGADCRLCRIPRRTPVAQRRRQPRPAGDAARRNARSSPPARRARTPPFPRSN